MDLKVVLWSVALFFGSGIVFRAVSSATADSPVAARVGAQVAVLTIIIAAVVLYVKRREE